MTTYAYRTDTAELLAAWDTGQGACATAVTTVADAEQGMRLAAALTNLSETAWGLYTAPPTARGNFEEVNTSAWRDQHALEGLERLPEVLTHPNLPDSGATVFS